MATTTCGYCKRITHMTISGSTVSNSSDTMYGRVWRTQGAFTCDNCGNLSVAQAYGDEDPNRVGKDPFATASRVFWHPTGSDQIEYEDVPPHIAEAAAEAHACASINAFRGAVLLARAVIEATAKEHGITAGRLVEKIDAMAAQGLIRTAVAVAAHEVRHLGNDMAHGDFVNEVTQADSEDALTIMADVLEEVFQSPARIARMKERREAKKAEGSTA